MKVNMLNIFYAVISKFNITENNPTQTSQRAKRKQWLPTSWRTSFKFDTSHVAKPHSSVL